MAAQASVSDVGSGVATISTSEASETENSTTSEIPAPVSSRMTSNRGARDWMTFRNWLRTSGVRREYSTMPEPAKTTEKPPGAAITASSRLDLPVNTSCSVILGCRLSTTSRLARPRSASSTRTRWPRRVRAAARLAETKVLPTPPLPLVTAMMRAPWVVAAGESGVVGDGASLISLLSVGAVVEVHGRQVAPARRGVEGAEKHPLFFGSDGAVRLFLDAYTVAAFRFCPVELVIGTVGPERRGRTDPLQGKGTTNTDGDVQFGAAVDAHGGGGNGSADALGDGPAEGRLACGQHHGELFPAIAGQGVHGAHTTVQCACDGLQHPVAGKVPISIVDLLEAVDVEHQQQCGLS